MLLRKNLQLSNAANWEQIANRNLTAAPGTLTGTFLPIPPQVIGLSTNSPVLAIAMQSTSAKPYWRFAGICNLKYDVPVEEGGVFFAFSNNRQKLWLNGANLIFPPDISSNYGIVIEIPYWFSQMSLYVWHYIGSYTSELDAEVNFIKAELADMQSDLDFIKTAIVSPTP